MLKKRLIGVVIVRDGWAVQSVGYRRYLPLGKVECVVENLDRWGADEILVSSIDRSSESQGPDLPLLRRVARIGIRTPLIVAGGISTREHAIEVVHSGADRLCVDAVLRTDPDAVHAMAKSVGAQALIASLPISSVAGGVQWYDYRTRCYSGFSPAVSALLEDEVISEVLVTDWQHEGSFRAFDTALVEEFPFRKVPLIAFGGISHSEQIASLLRKENVSAVAIGNFLSYREHCIHWLKAQLDGVPLRRTGYESGGLNA